jgi:methylated-DNA-protein-cysteine methyltransferase-like protein
LNRLEDLWQLVREIPLGEVRTYGELGRELQNPTSGRIVGRWMAQAPADVPWWRVVAAHGVIATWKRDPRLGQLQAQLLQEEGHSIENGRLKELGSKAGKNHGS